MSSTASLETIKQQIDRVAKSRGYRCENVSWNDVSRFTDGATGGLSAFGDNISDATLWARDSRLLFTVRSENWNERLGLVSAKDIALVVGNHLPPPSQQQAAVDRPEPTPLSNVSLAEYLARAGEFAGYAGLKTRSLAASVDGDERVSVRFQTCFLPLNESNKTVESLRDVQENIDSNKSAAAAVAVAVNDNKSNEQQQQQQQQQVLLPPNNQAVAEKEQEDEERREQQRIQHALAEQQNPDLRPGCIEFAPASFSYATDDCLHPANAILLATAQGTFFQQDMKGTTLQFLHQLDAAGNTWRYWCEAERSRFEVGKEQQESNAEIAAAAARGKATAARPIGTAAMGKRMNALLSVQIPLEINFDADENRAQYFAAAGFGGAPAPAKKKIVKKTRSKTGKHGAAKVWETEVSCDEADDDDSSSSSAPVGVSRAARLSRGSRHDRFFGVIRGDMTRDDSQRCTVTVILFNTVSGGVPSEADVLAAVDDLDNLYKSCSADVKRGDAEAAVVNKAVANSAAAEALVAAKLE